MDEFSRGKAADRRTIYRNGRLSSPVLVPLRPPFWWLFARRFGRVRRSVTADHLDDGAFSADALGVVPEVDTPKGAFIGFQADGMRLTAVGDELRQAMRLLRAVFEMENDATEAHRRSRG